MGTFAEMEKEIAEIVVKRRLEQVRNMTRQSHSVQACTYQTRNAVQRTSNNSPLNSSLSMDPRLGRSQKGWCSHSRIPDLGAFRVSVSDSISGPGLGT